MIKTRFLIFLSITILLAILWSFILPGPRVATDYSFVSTSSLKNSMSFPLVWSEKGTESLGEYTAFTLWSWPMNFLSGLLANFNINFIWQERIFLLTFFLVPGIWGIWKLMSYLKLSPYARLAGSLLYLTNTYILLLIDGGQLSIAFAFAWFPICFLAVEQGVTGRLTKKVLAGLSIAVLGFFDIRFVYILFLLLFLRFLYQLALHKNKRTRISLEWLKTGLLAMLVFGLIHFYWLLPLLKVPLSADTYSYLTKTAFSTFIEPGHSLSLLSPHWYKNIFGKITTLQVEFLVIPIVVFLAPVLKTKDKEIAFWLVVAVISVFLTKGASPPFAESYYWLFENIPGFSLFRDSSKFFFLVALSYSVLFAKGIEEILKKTNRLSRTQNLLLVIIILYILFLIRPVLFNQMTGTLSPPPFTKEFAKLASYLESDPNFSRVFWIPAIAPLGYSSPTHPILEASRLVQKRPFGIGTVGTYETFNFLREAPFTGELFKVAGIGYLAYPYLDVRRADMHPDNIRYYYAFLKQIDNLPWIEKQIPQSPIPLFKTKSHQDRFFFVENIFWVIGSDDLYRESTKSAGLSLTKNTLVFAEESPGLSQRLNETPNAKVVLNKKEFTDFAASFIPQDKIIFPAKNLKSDPDQTGWWKREKSDLISWREFLQTKYRVNNQDFDLGGGWAVAEGSLSLTLENTKFQPGNILLARVLEGTQSGELKFYQEQGLVGQITTQREGENVRWIEVGELKNSSSSITIETSGSINVVNALASLSLEEWSLYQKAAKKYEKQLSAFESTTDQNLPSITYQQINSTKYKIRVSNLHEPRMLIFSQVYDPNWKIEGQKPLPVYSLLNGFMIDKEGEYIVEFELQKYVYQGLIISTLSLLFVAGLILKER